MNFNAEGKIPCLKQVFNKCKRGCKIERYESLNNFELFKLSYKFGINDVNK